MKNHRGGGDTRDAASRHRKRAMQRALVRNETNNVLHAARDRVSGLCEVKETKRGMKSRDDDPRTNAATGVNRRVSHSHLVRTRDNA